MLTYESVMHIAKTDTGYGISFRKLSIGGQFALAAAACDAMWHHMTENGNAKVRAFRQSKQSIRISENIIEGKDSAEKLTLALFRSFKVVSDFIEKNPKYGYYSLDGHLACACAILMLVHKSKPDLAVKWLGYVRKLCHMIGVNPATSLSAGPVSRMITETIGEIDYETDGNV
jgi:hypothetical protein